MSLRERVSTSSDDAIAPMEERQPPPQAARGGLVGDAVLAAARQPLRL